uniref:DDE_Tnp_1_7 domain-containing protein n=1 Tax=Macrostomum lignano TaxID=282301 RepID=A0A1I8JK10_9PLAT
DLLGFGYHLFVDKWFASVRLATFLYERSTLLTATVRADRGVPLALRSQQVPLNDVVFMRKLPVLAMKILERKESGLKTFFMIDTHGSAQKVATNRIRKNGEAVQVQKSASNLLYNRCMGGVDRLDAMLKPYDSCRKTYKWFHKLGFHLCLLLVHNAWVVYSKHGGRLQFFKFLESCITLLVDSTGPGRQRTAARQPAAAAAQQHFPSKLPPRESCPRPVKRCRVCYRNGTAKRTVFCCSACPNAPGLCPSPCFERWHVNCLAKAGFDNQAITLMTGHKNSSSVDVYKRRDMDCVARMSACLAAYGSKVTKIDDDAESTIESVTTGSDRGELMKAPEDGQDLLRSLCGGQFHNCTFNFYGK